jgi:formylmethanofuran dehydrogenase subunit E
MEEKVELTFITLECGHTVTPEVGMGVCSKCGKASCSKCLQLVNGKLLCPECFEKFVRDNDGSSKH